MATSEKDSSIKTKFVQGCVSFQIFAALIIGGLGGISVGAVLGFSAILLPKLGPDVTVTEKSWIASLPNLSQLLGALVAGYASNKIGRKKSMILFCLPLLCGWVTIIFASGNSSIIMIGRLLKGFGMMPSIAQVYLVEVVQEHRRNLYGTIFAISISFGITITYICGYLMNNYESVCWIFTATTLLLMISVYFLPESPVWLKQSGQFEKASSAAKTLWGAQYELKNDSNEKIPEDHGPSFFETLKEFQFPAAYKPMIILIVLWTLQQFCGNYAVIFYAVDVFSGIGSDHVSVDIYEDKLLRFGNNSQFINSTSVYSIDHHEEMMTTAFQAAITVGCMRIAASLFGAFLVTRFSKRTLMVVSSIMMTICMTSLAATVYYKEMCLKSDEAWLRWITVIETSGFIFSFGIGMNLVPWLLIGELCPPKVRAISSAIAVTVCAISIFAVVKMFPLLAILIGAYGTYGCFAAVCLLCIPFSVIMIPDSRPQSKDTKVNELPQRTALERTLSSVSIY